MTPDRVESPLLPGGNLVAALFDREVMTLADRGGASNLVGDRWADLAAAHAETWVGQIRTSSEGEAHPFHITRVDRLDATPRVAAAASKRGLQNPDLVLVGHRDGRRIIQAADAKFSVETARSKQVSPEVVRALLEIRDQVPDLLAGLDADAAVEPGIFLAPDYPLTHLMLRRRSGIVRTTVRSDEVALVPVAPDRFWHDVAGATIMAPLVRADDLPVRIDESLLAGVYYFRLARAAVGFWLDATKPLLLNNDPLSADEEAVRDEAARRAQAAPSAIELVRQWDADVQTIRNQRAAVEQVAGFPIPGRELRPRVAQIAEAAGGPPPSANQARRRLGAWYRGELRARVGPLSPPVRDLPAELRRVSAAARELAPLAQQEMERVVLELIAETRAEESAADATATS